MAITNPTSDNEIRSAFHNSRLRQDHRCPETLVIDELGLVHGKNRIDIAVLNGCLHGYEIKSSKDNLNRFSDQLDVYRHSLEKLTLVVAPNHLCDVTKSIPKWCGLISAEKNSYGELSFTTIEEAKTNPEVETLYLAHLLWRAEALNILRDLGVNDLKKNANRAELYKKLALLLTCNELTVLIKKQFKLRETWRVAPQLLLGDD